MRVEDLAGKILANEIAGSLMAAAGQPEAESVAVKGPRTRPDLTIWVQQSMRIEHIYGCTNIRRYEYMDMRTYRYEDISSKIM